MNISYNWLNRHLDLGELSAEEVGKMLTSIGLEVEGVEEHESVPGGLRGVVIGKVLSCKEHENSDHLHITTVDLGSDYTPEAPLQIVCGAPNIAEGQTVPVATVGTVLYSKEGEPFTIKKGKIRGVESEGMICSADELGVGSDSAGIMVLPSEIPAGTSAADYFEVSKDFVLSVDLTPNRVDASSHRGVARDLHAFLSTHGMGGELKPLQAPEVAGSGMPVELKLLSPEACYRYAGVVIRGMKVGESPKWLRESLEAVGQKSINNVVDAANYVLLDLGQPLHTFDLAKIEGGEVNVRLAREGEKLVTLDGVERTLSAQDLVIADAKKPMCLAGVMGGIDSGVGEETTDLFLEVATFHPTYIRKSARRHGINSDASFRFERGLDPNSVPFALRYAVDLILKVAGGKVASAVYDEYPTPQTPYEVSLSIEEVGRLLGLELGEERIIELLQALEIEVVERKEGRLELRVPRYRYDVTRDIDVIEELIRIHGYNEIPERERLTSTLSRMTDTDKSVHLQQKISEQLVGAGFFEIMNNSLSKESYYTSEKLKPLRVTLENPLSADLSTLRMTLLHGGLEVIEFNLNRRIGALRLFEFGNVYRKATPDETTPLPGYAEDFRLALWMTGDSAPHNWATPERLVMPFELKATLQNIFARLGLNESEIEVLPIEGDERFEKGEKYILRGGKGIVKWGVVSRDISEKLHDISCPVFYAEVKWNEIMRRVLHRTPKIVPVAKYPSVKRDFALLLDSGVPFSDVERVAKKVERKLLRAVTLFDVYEDPKHLPEGKKSYAVTFELQDPDKTLSDKVIEKTMKKIFDALHSELGAELR